MASRTLFPPIVNDFEPAFVAGSSSQLRVYFSLSSLSSITSISNLTVHASITRKDGVKVLNTTNDVYNERYRATGIILNLIPQRDSSLGDNYYYVVINNNDLKSSATLSGVTYNGWIPGWTYKIQLRLSTEVYPGGIVKQAAWLQEHSNSFSEWSSVCYTKAISEMAIQIPIFEYDSTDTAGSYNFKTVHTLTDMEFNGSLSSLIPEANENYKFIRTLIYQDDILLEDSGEIYKTELSNSYFSYKFKTKFKDNNFYDLVFNYETENGYKLSNPLKFSFKMSSTAGDTIEAEIITADTHASMLSDATSIGQEEEEGRIGLKLHSETLVNYFGNIGIYRSSMEDNFSTWEEIKIITLKNTNINNYPIIYDYTIKSGVWYRYGVASVSFTGARGHIVEMHTPIQRIFNHSYLLGEGGRQLKLCFNTVLSSFKQQVSESSQDTIGSKYSFFSRNAAVGYKTFPLSSTISFQADDNNTFLTNGKRDLYASSSIIEDYENYNREHDITYYDYTFERDFRDKVLEFLYDGKPKLFKSPTEGNLIIRLTDVNCSPNKTLSRMIYDFSATAKEIDDGTQENYLKYGFYNPGTYSTNISIKDYYIGQLDGNFNVTDNIFKLIYDKYDGKNNNFNNTVRHLANIEKVKITINDPPLRVKNSDQNFVMGNNLKLITNGNTSIITIYNANGIYEFDSLIDFHYFGENTIGNDELYLMGDADGMITKINATIDFVYSLKVESYETQSIKRIKITNGIGQFIEEVQPNSSIFNSIYYKYYNKDNIGTRRLNTLSNVEIEANPYTVFGVYTKDIPTMQVYEMDETGVLNLNVLENISNLIYLGKRYETIMYDKKTLSEEIITTDTEVIDPLGNKTTIRASADVMVTYIYEMVEEQYN